ncbi:MAG: hypothetical protein IKV55_00860 [Oscillospiraceae bacterium]|nr:hypothetical protein [Oscillospiraceae bacterium]
MIFMYGPYPEGNAELFSLLAAPSFDAARAEELIKHIPRIDALVVDRMNHPTFPTTYLNAATEKNIIEAVRLLFQYGADPNFNSGDDDVCPFWDLQYCEEDPAWNTVHLEIAKLFLEQGADPNLPAINEWETLYEWVYYKDGEDDWPLENGKNYVHEFLKLLEAYGGRFRSGQ